MSICGTKSPCCTWTGCIWPSPAARCKSKRRFDGRLSGVLLFSCIMRTVAGIALCCALIFAALSAQAERRVVLVIGNDRYAHLPNLNNAGKDARDMAAKLKTLGFEIIARYNASERDMVRAIRKFSARLSAGGTGLAFYAGHGVQADGTNYLIPADAAVEVEDDLRSEAVDANEILRAMKDAGNPLNILILDACRDNPLPKRVRSAARGLAITAVPSGAKGTAILYAAGPGQTAQDGPKGGNGVFTGALLRHMDQPGWTLEQVFKATSREVLRATNNRQRPWQLVSLQGDFVFKQAVKQPDQAATRPPADQTVELTFWNSVKDSDNAAVLEAYLVQYPNGIFAGLARLRIGELQAKVARGDEDTARLEAARRKQAEAEAAQRAADARLARQRTAREAARGRERDLWQAVSNSEDPAVVQAFLDKYPNGDYAALARARLGTLNARFKQADTSKLAAMKEKQTAERDPHTIFGNWVGESLPCNRENAINQGWDASYKVDITIRDGRVVGHVIRTIWGQRYEPINAKLQLSKSGKLILIVFETEMRVEFSGDRSRARAKMADCDFELTRK